MIAKLTGTLDSIFEDHIILDVQGVGYAVHLHSRALSQLPPTGSEISFLIDPLLRQDSIVLFGFTSSEEKFWFKRLQTIQGVGSKVALALLGVLSIEELIMAITAGDAARVAQADGVGKKLAQRIVAELQDKIDKISISLPILHSIGMTAHQEALSALINLGYKRFEAAQSLAKAVQQAGDTAGLDVLIRLSLQNLSKA